MKHEYPYQNLSLKDMKREVWEDVPGFEDYYQVSNYGRIKGLERWIERKSIKGDLHLPEQILKQTKSEAFNPYTKKKYPRLTISLCRNAQKKGISPGRMVYYFFVKKFKLEDPTIVISPKNGDYLNNRHTNLLLIKKTEVQTRTYREGQKRKLFKKISQYDADGHLIDTYNSVLDAAAKTGFTPSTLSGAASGRLRHCGGWLWRLGTRKKIQAIEFPYRHVRRVAQYTPDGKLVNSYFSITEAEKVTGFDDIGIRDSALKKRSSYKGFVWKYVE